MWHEANILAHECSVPKEKKNTNKQFGGVWIGFWSWKRMMRMQGCFYHRSVGLWAGSPSLLHRGTRQEAILKWDAFPQALSHSWHFGCMCVWLCVVFRVKGGGLCFRPKTRLPPLPCYLFPPPLPLLTLLQLDPVSHLPIHLKAQNTYWDPIWGWGRGAWVGPQQGWNTQQQHDEHKEEVESEG